MMTTAHATRVPQEDLRAAFHNWRFPGGALVLLPCVFVACLLYSLARVPSYREDHFRLPPMAPQNVTDAPASGTRGDAPVSALFGELSRCRPSLAENLRWRIAGAIHDQSRRYGYDPLFVMAMIMVESSCSPVARGPKGALGLIQIQPETGRAVAQEAGVTWSGAATLTRPIPNLKLGLHYLWTLERLLHDPYTALAAYNMGPAHASAMGRQRARRAPYVRKVIDRYEDLLAARSERTS